MNIVEMKIAEIEDPLCRSVTQIDLPSRHRKLRRDTSLTNFVAF